MSALASAAPVAAAAGKAGRTGALALAAGMAVAVKQGVSFEKQMDNVQAKLLTTERNMRGLSDFALKLGANTQFSAAEAAGAMEELAAQGFTVREIYKTLPGTLDLAAASGTDLASAAEIQSATIRGFGLAAKDATHVADVLAQTTNKSAVSMSDLGETLPYVASTAKATGTSFEQVAAAAGILGNAGILGSRAGTALRTSMLRLTDPSKKMVGIFDELGLKTKDLAAVPLPKVIGLIAEKIKGLPRGEAVGIVSAIFGKEAAPAMLNLMAKGRKEIDRMAKSLENSEGAADRAAKIMRENVAGAWDNFTGSVETASIKLSRTFMPALRTVLNQAAKGVNIGTGVIERVGVGAGAGIRGRRDPDAAGAVAVGQKIGTVARTVGAAAVSAGRQLLDAFKPALPFFQNVLLPLLEGVARGLIGGLVAAFKIAIPIIKVAATALGFLGRILAPFKGLIRTIGMVIGFVFGGQILVRAAGGVAKLGSALRVLGGPIRLTGRLLKGLGEGIIRVGGWFAAAAGRIGGALRSLPGIAGRVIGSVFNWFRRGAKRLSSLAIDLVTGIARPFGSLGGKIIAKARSALSDIYGFFKRVGGGIVRAIVGVMKDAPDAIKKALLSLVPGPIKGAVRSIFGGRAGGRVPRMQGGGMVPIAAAGGEMLVAGNRAMMIPGDPRRDGTLLLAPERSAVLTGDGQARMAAGMSLTQAILTQAPHFARGGKVPKWWGPEKVTPGKYTSTSYGPPWGGIQGTGKTRTGVDLRSGPRRYIVAVDPSLISLKSKVYAQPNPFGYGGQFSAEDTGGAIKGRRIDFYDWRGRAKQKAWGRKQVTLSSKRIAKGDTTAATTLGRSLTRAGLLEDAFETGRAAGREGLTRAIIGAEGNPILKAIREQTQTPPSKSSPGRQVTTNDPPGSVARTRSIAASTRAPYVFGGGHGSFNASGGLDCSGYVSYIAHKAGWQPKMTAPMATGALSGYGRSGRGKHITIHVRNGGPAGGHTMLTIDGKGYSSGNRRTGRLSGRYDVGAAYLRTLPIKRHPIGMQRGGIVPGRALTSGLATAMTGAGGSLKALDDVIGRTMEARLLVFRAQIAKRVQAGGVKKVVDRLRSVLSVIDFELARRIGRIEDVIEKRTAALERGRGMVERGMRAVGITPESTRGLGIMAGVQAAETGVRAQNVRSLQSALRRASAVGNRSAMREITEQLRTAQDELQESLVRQIEIARDRIRAVGTERVANAQFWLGLAQTGAAGLEVGQRLAGTQDTPEGMRQRAHHLQAGVIPYMQMQLQAHQANAQLLASIGDLEGWRGAVQDAAQAAVDIAGAHADAADLMREAAMRAVQDIVDVTSHQAGMAGRGLQRIELEQRLAGTFESAGAGQARAEFIRRQIIPAMDAEIIALERQRMEAEAQGNASLVRQLREQIFDKQNEILQANLDANEQTAANTDALKEFGGSTAFSYREQVMTDLDVMAARMGA